MGKLTRNLPRISPIPEHRICCEYHMEKAQFFCTHCHTSICDFCANDQHLEHTFQALEKVQQCPANTPTATNSMCDKSVQARVQDIEKALAQLDLEALSKKC